MGQYGRRRKDSTKDKWIKEEVAAALGIASVTAGSKLKNAEQLCRRLSVTRELLLAGRITAVQARVITEASNVLSDDVLRCSRSGCCGGPRNRRSAS
jgi:hypothetical protein